MSYLVEHWSFDPFVVVGALAIGLHEIGLHSLRRRPTHEGTRQRRIRSVAFYGGLAVLLVAVASPIDYWAGDYFFVHMIEHILIMFFAPLLIVLGSPWLGLVHAVPVSLRRRIGRSVLLGAWARPLRATGRILRDGWVAVVGLNLVMILWHVPALFDVAQENRLVHIWLMHGSFVAFGVLFWLQIVPSHPFEPKLSYPGRIAALVLTNVTMLVLAIAMSILTSASWYSVYDHVKGVGLSPFADQQIGAAILWVCGDFWALPALIVVVRNAIEEEGGVGILVDKVLHRPPVPG